MGHEVTSWFVDQLRATSKAPVLTLTIGGSDYSNRVSRWPTIRQTAQEFKSAQPRIGLNNHDGLFNFFFTEIYTMAQSGTGGREVLIDMGFTHPTSGTESVRVYTGRLKMVKFKEGKIDLIVKDKMAEMQVLVVGDTDTPVQYSGSIPTDVLWDLCSSYGGLSNVASTSNPDLHYASFNEVAAVFSGDAITIDAEFKGKKVPAAISEVLKMTDASMFDPGDGLIHFARFAEATSLDTLIEERYILKAPLDVDATRMINKQIIFGDYSVASKDWGLSVNAVSSLSVASFGTQENILKSDLVWYTNSSHARNMAARKVTLYADPPKLFDIETAGAGMERQISETIRFVDSFTGVTSASAWRITELDLNLQTFTYKTKLDSAFTLEAFFLDVDFLDGNKALL